MAVELVLRNGTAAENDGFTGALAEVTVDNTNKTLRVHDGSNAGGTSLLSGSSTTDDLSEGSSNLYYTDARTRAALSASGDLSYNSSTGEFSVTVPEGYDSTDFDTDFSGKDTDDLSEGANNLYYTDTRAQNALSANGDLSYDSTTGTFSFTERTDAEVRGLISGATGIDYSNSTGAISLADTTVTAGTFGSASEVPVITVDSQGRITSASTTNVAGVSSFLYDSATGDLDIGTADGSTFTATVDLGPFTTTDLAEGTNLYYTDARVDAHLSGGTGVTFSSGTISIGQPVATTDDVTFNDVVVDGNLTISGTTTTVNTETIELADNNIVLNSNFTGSSPTENGGITINRGTLTDAVLQFNETDDYWEIASGGTTGRILTENDEGSGNGLDADLLDGQQGSHYLDFNNFTNTPTIGDGTLTVSGGSGLTGSGSFDANQTTNASITVSHADTSTQASVSNTGNTVIQNVTLDEFGHITALSSKTIDPPTLDTLGLDTDDSVQHGSLGIGTAATGVTGEIVATGDITTNASDDRLKNRLGSIENALDKIESLSGFYFEFNDTAIDLGLQSGRRVGVSAQEVNDVLPEVIRQSPVSEEYMTVQYEKLVPLLIEAIKEQQQQINMLKNGCGCGGCCS